jgi:hypothetical protein
MRALDDEEEVEPRWSAAVSVKTLPSTSSPNLARVLVSLEQEGRSRSCNQHEGQLRTRPASRIIHAGTTSDSVGSTMCDSTRNAARASRHHTFNQVSACGGPLLPHQCSVAGAVGCTIRQRVFKLRIESVVSAW